jgi:hypothetical protein
MNFAFARGGSRLISHVQLFTQAVHKDQIYALLQVARLRLVSRLIGTNKTDGESDMRVIWAKAPATNTAAIGAQVAA